MKKAKLCHTECIGKQWELMELDGDTWAKTLYVKTFDCLAEARKAMITYIKNPDFQNLEFKLKKV